MKRSITFIICILFSVNIIAQDKDTVYNYIRPKHKPTLNSVYIGILGTGILPISLNYERIIINKERHQFSGRIGYAYNFFLAGEDVTPWSVPFELNFAMGSKHHLDLGIGMTYNYGIVACGNCGAAINKQSASSALYSSYRIGYKYKKEKGHFFFLLSANPFIRIKEFNSNPPAFLIDDYEQNKAFFWVGVGTGYSF